MLTVFNSTGNDVKSERKSFYGNTTGIINLNNVKHLWAVDLWRQMRENFWISEKVDLSLDVVTYNELTNSERRAFNGILGYLVFLDSVQVQNIPHLVRPCSAPELSICFSEQLSQETLHSQCYAYMIEAIIPKEKRDSIYDYWRDDKLLLERCQFIGSYYQRYIDNPTRENHFIALIADYILEGLYFYTGFIFFYNLASRSLMCGSADAFKYINRDELSHVRLYQKLLIQSIEENPMFEQLANEWVGEMFSKAVEQEIKWNAHIIGDHVLGMPQSGIEEYVKYLANIRLRALGFNELYSGVQNRFKHLEKIADTKADANVKTNFFDSTVTSYQMSTALSGFDEF